MSSSASLVLALGGNHASVWAISLSERLSEYDDLFTCLTADEQARAERYLSATVRHQFVITRGHLRRLLSLILGTTPKEARIIYTASGKPVLAGESANLHFNVTHTEGLALIAMAQQPIGIDVERLRPVSEPEALVRRFFSPRECEKFLSLPESLRPEGFFRGWTCKEAVIKAAALSVAALDAFDVELHPARPPALLDARQPELAAATWQLSAWEPAPGYRAAVALQDFSPLAPRTVE